MAKNKVNLITKAIGIVGLTRLADGCGVTTQAIRKWEASGLLPRTEWTGETTYSEVIQRMTTGKVTKRQLLAAR